MCLPDALPSEDYRQGVGFGPDGVGLSSDGDSSDGVSSDGVSSDD